MTATIIDGRALARDIRTSVAQRVQDTAGRIGRPPTLAALVVGDDEATGSYLRMQGRAAEKLGIVFEHVALAANVGASHVAARLDELSRSRSTDAVLLAAPLPRGYDTFGLRQHIAPDKDVEGVTAESQGRLAVGADGPRPATAAAIITCLDATDVRLEGAEAVVVGRSVVVGKPTALWLLERHATVTLCHSRTRGLADVTRRADVLVAAVGVPGLITEEHVKRGAAVIDAGTNSVGEGDDWRLVGDVAPDRVHEVAGWLTPVPGGVGPVTTAVLMRNVVELASRRHGLEV